MKRQAVRRSTIERQDLDFELTQGFLRRPKALSRGPFCCPTLSQATASLISSQKAYAQGHAVSQWSLYEEPSTGGGTASPEKALIAPYYIALQILARSVAKRFLVDSGRLSGHLLPGSVHNFRKVLIGISHTALV